MREGSSPRMMQVTRAAFQVVANLNKQATDPMSHTPVRNSYNRFSPLPLPAKFRWWTPFWLAALEANAAGAASERSQARRGPGCGAGVQDCKNSKS